MPRKIRSGGSISVIGAIVSGASDATVSVGNLALTTSVFVAVPINAVSLLQCNLLTKVVGATTGTFSVQVLCGSGDVPLTAATATTFIDADAAVTTMYQIDGISHAKLTFGDILKIATVKAGTVSTGVTFEVHFIFSVAP
jgi:hypothetical protein